MSSSQSFGVNASLAVRRARSASAMICAAVLATVVVAACTSANEDNDTEEKPELAAPELAIFTLSNGKKLHPDREKVAQNTTVLPDDARAQILSRLPELKKGEATDFKLPEATLQPLPPKAGTTEKSVFPPPSGVDGKQPAKPKQSAEPLKILRHVPDGDVEKDTTLSITFSQPMVPVTTVGQNAAKIPVTLTPMPKGEWKWLGTETLTFVPEKGSLPGSTSFTVDVPAGITSSTNGKLESGLQWSFSTPRNRVLEWYPVRYASPLSASRDPIILAVLAQPVEPDDFLKALEVAGGQVKTELRIVSAADARRDKKLKPIIERVESEKKNWIAFRATKPFPGPIEVSLRLKPGLGSTEGPLTSDETFSNSFHTYGPLKITETYGYNGRPKQVTIRFSNPLKTDSVKEESIEVTPAVDDLRLGYSYDSTVQLTGSFKANSKYKVRLKNVEDEYEQKLEDETTSVDFGPPDPSLICGYGQLITLERGKETAYTILSSGHRSLNVGVYAANPSLWTSFQNSYYEKAPKGAKLLSSKSFTLDPNIEDSETKIDLKPFLTNGYGHIIITAQTPEPHKYNSMVWVQFTDLGLDAFTDSKNVTAWVTSLNDGKPLSDVTVSNGKNNARTDGEGLARLAESNTQMMTARRGDDLVMLPGYWNTYHHKDSIVWYGASDRGLYKPGETVKAKGWVRQRGFGPKARLAIVPGGGLSVSYNVQDNRGNPIGKGKVPVDGQGGFTFDFLVPKNANLGQARATLTLDRNGQTATTYERNGGSLPFDVQEFRRPEFEMKVSDLKPRSLLLGETGTLQASAHYYSGGALGETPVKWTVSASPGFFTPAGWEDYSFAGGDYEFLRDKRPQGVKFGDAFVSESSPLDSWPYNMFDLTGKRLTKTFDGKTDFNGEHVLDVSVAKISQSVPLSFEVSGTVEDENRQSWTDKQTLLFHPANVYVGLKNEAYFVEDGQPLSISAIVSDLDGKLQNGKTVELDIFREKQVKKGNEYVSERKQAGHRSLTSAKEPVNLKVDATAGEGDYVIVATVRDDENRTSKTELRVWCMGAWSLNTSIEQSASKVMADKKEYAPGETASVLVSSPFAPFHGLLNVKREGIVKTIRFDSDKNTCSVKIPIDEDCVPSVTVDVDLVGNKPIDDASNNATSATPSNTKTSSETVPAFARGSVKLSVPPKHHGLSIAVNPAQANLEPGAETSVNLELKDMQAKPVSGGQVAVAVVDESVLALTGYRIKTPLDSFYENSDPAISETFSRHSVYVGNRESNAHSIGRKSISMRRTRGYYGGGGGGGAYYSDQMRCYGNAPVLQGATNGTIGSCDEAAAVPMSCPVPSPAPSGPAGITLEGVPNAGATPKKIALRSNFDALAAFVPVVVTDKDGKASIKVKLPDSLTRYRIMAVAAAGTGEFGKGESSLTARLPLMVKPSFPRFLRFGDIAELPVMVHNQTDRNLTVDVALRGNNIEIMEQGKRLTVGANDRVEVRFKASASRAGMSILQVVASSGSYSDASEQTLPVYTPATTEAFATYGVVDDSKAVFQPVERPKDVYTQFGDLEITSSSTALQSLVDAYHYLEDYDYACSEQLSARLLSMLALRDVMEAFKTQSNKDRTTTTRLMNDDIRVLLSRQRDKGDFGLWKRGDDHDWPYASIQVTRALIVAKQKGFNVPQSNLDYSLRYLRNIENYLSREDYSEEAIKSLQSYSQYVLAMAGKAELDEARNLLTQGLRDIKPGTRDRDREWWWHGGITDYMESVGWLVCTLSKDPASKELVDKAKKLMESRIDETASTADVLGGSYGEAYNYRMFWCPKRLNAVVLEALMINDPKNPVIPKLVNGLLGDRHKGRWESTQENFNVLLALDRYFNTYEKVTPDFRVNMWLGNSFAGKQEFRGRSTVSKSVSVPMSYIAKEDKQDVTLQKDGPGRLYYRIGMRYAPKNLALTAMDRGFAVKRTYEAVDRKEDVRQEKDGTWHIAPGAQVRVNLEMQAPSSRFHVALNDPLPAGLEISNPELRGNKQSTGPQQQWSWWSWNWYQHQNLKDDRAEAFSSVVWGGTYKYSYIARATTPGTYQVPPTKAEEMYAPETFGRSASDLVIVE